MTHRLWSGTQWAQAQARATGSRSRGLAVAALVLAATGCGPSRPAAESGPDPAFAGPIQSTDAAAGEEHYQRYCAGCHDGGGGVPALAGIAWPAGRVRQQVRQGEGQMPAFSRSRLSDADLEALLAYLVTINAAADEAAASSGGGASGGSGEPGGTQGGEQTTTQ